MVLVLGYQKKKRIYPKINYCIKYPKHYVFKTLGKQKRLNLF